MAWAIKDEWIDAGAARHVVVFHNRDVHVLDAEGKKVPAEHHLVHEFKLLHCPHCKHPKVDEQGEPVDFHQTKQDVLAALNDHHATVMTYREKHPNVRIGHGPKA